MTTAPAVEEVLREMRGALASLRAAAETLQGFPEMERGLRDRLLGVLTEESLRLSERLQRLEHELRRAPAADAPALEPVELGALLAELARGLDALGARTTVEAPPPELAATHVAVPRAALARELERFFAALRRGSRVGACGLRARPADRHVRVDLFWSPEPGDLAWLLEWQGEALGGGPPGQPAGGLRAVVRAADGAAWFTLDRDGATAHVRLLLPQTTAP